MTSLLEDAECRQRIVFQWTAEHCLRTSVIFQSGPLSFELLRTSLKAGGNAQILLCLLEIQLTSPDPTHHLQHHHAGKIGFCLHSSMHVFIAIFLIYNVCISQLLF